MKSKGNTKTHGEKRKWSRNVKTESTFPPPGTFSKTGDEIARIMARKEVSPRGLGSAIRMVQMFINRSGRKLGAERRTELERAKMLLQRRLHRRRTVQQHNLAITLRRECCRS
jgi:hypothetical protein